MKTIIVDALCKATENTTVLGYAVMSAFLICMWVQSARASLRAKGQLGECATKED